MLSTHAYRVADYSVSRTTKSGRRRVGVGGRFAVPPEYRSCPSATHPTTPPTPAQLPSWQQRLVTFHESFWASNLSALFIAALMGLTVKAAMQQLIVGFTLTTLAGWYGRVFYDKLVQRARSDLSSWKWESWNSIVVTFEDALVAKGSQKLHVRLRITNVSPIAWSLRTGKIEMVQIGYGSSSIHPLLLTGAVPGNIVLENEGHYEIVEFTGAIPDHHQDGSWIPVVIGASPHPDNLVRGVAGYLDIQREGGAEPAHVIPHLMGVARISDGSH